MELLVNENGEIVGYASVGGCGGIEIDDNILPEGFEDNFVPSFYLYQNNKILKNPDYTIVPDQPVKPTGPTSEQVALTALAQGCSGSLARIKILEQSTTDLSKDYSDALKHISSLEKSLTELTIEKAGGIEDDGNENGL